MTAFESAQREEILLYRILSNATHLMQSLDKGVFGALKQKWYAVARVHSRENPGAQIGKDSFAEKLKEAYILFYKPIILVNSFRASVIDIPGG
ncbi:hypothetical protein DPMN_084199 [Dreissena polymorpha]|uniref:Uncharacterized protein n=1 Tax=Dreissena polymorpha TaxID=45954 RepID=A0A9D3YAB5_DREPO|nr:hypothetical protein DPMN_084199 [Dreissena polymorpha]